MDDDLTLNESSNTRYCLSDYITTISTSGEPIVRHHGIISNPIEFDFDDYYNSRHQEESISICMNKIEELKKENKEMRKRLANLTSLMLDFMGKEQLKKFNIKFQEEKNGD